MRKPYYNCIDCGKHIWVKNGRCRSCEMIYRQRKSEFHWNYQNKRPKCLICNKLIEYKAKLCWKCYNKDRLKNPQNLGIKNPMWKGGLSFLPYPSQFNNYLKRKIRKRDNYICQKCGITEEQHLKIYGAILYIHHIDYDKQNNQENNLITLCNKCNIKANYNRKYWKQYFKEKIRM